MNVIKEFLFGRNDILQDLEEDAEKDLQILQDIFFLHKQKIDSIRELLKIWKTSSKVSKIDKLGKWIKDYNEKLVILIRKILKVKSREVSIIKLLITRNEEFAREFEVHDIESLLKRMEKQLIYLETILHELNFIIGEEIKYIKEQSNGIVIILKEIKLHKRFYYLLQDEVEVEKKINNLVRMFEREALSLHKEKKQRVEGNFSIEEVYSPESADFKLLYKEVYREAFPDAGELLAFEDFQDELKKRYKKLDKAYYHILILKVGTTPVGGIMFDLYPVTKTSCVGVFYYFFVKKELLVDVEKGNMAAKMLQDAAISMLKRDTRYNGLELVALVIEVDNPERKTEYKLKTQLKMAKLKREDAENYKAELAKIVRMYRIMGFKKVDFNYAPSDLSNKKRTVTYLDFYVKPLKPKWAEGLHTSNFLPILTKFVDEAYELREEGERPGLYNKMRKEILSKPNGAVKLVNDDSKITITPGSELWYPGFKPGKEVIQNLSSYCPETRNSSIAFDIERTVRWESGELLPFTYSFMISIEFPVSSEAEIQSSLKLFKQKASQLKGFRIESERYKKDMFIDYRNQRQNNLLLNWIYEPESRSITIGVIQDKQLPSLKAVIESLPYCVKLFNYFSQYPLETDIVNRSIAIATESDKIIPRNREKEPEAYEAYLKRKRKET